jgi:hypothetical protein
MLEITQARQVRRGRAGGLVRVRYKGRTSLAALIALYSRRFPFLMDNLNMISLAPAGILLSLTAIEATLAAVQVVVFIQSIN